MEGKTFDIIGIGACILDSIAFVSKFTEKEEKINASGYVAPKPDDFLPALRIVISLSYSASSKNFEAIMTYLAQPVKMGLIERLHSCSNFATGPRRLL